MNKENVKKYLENHCKGRKRALTAERLVPKLSISEKELGKQVNRLRREGVPIANVGKGYFYAQNAGDVFDTIRMLVKLRNAIDAVIQGLIQSLNSFGDVS